MKALVGHKRSSAHDIGALIIRIGFWGPLDYVTIRNPQNSIGNYLSPRLAQHR